MGDRKNVLIVYAHQEPKSFNAALKDVAVTTLEAQGHTVTVSDLYEMRFDPTAYRHHFKEILNPDFFDFEAELGHAATSNSLPDDLKKEIEKLLRADLLILQFPMYWMGFPAIMKGWMDRCFVQKLTYDFDNRMWYDDGPFKDKKALLSLTAGATKLQLSEKGISGDVEVHLFPIQLSLRFTGYQVLAPQVTYAPQDFTPEIRAEMLQNWRKRLENIWVEEPIPFVHVKNFDPDKGFTLTEEYVESVKSDKTGPTAGHHMGKALPSKQREYFMSFSNSLC